MKMTHLLTTLMVAALLGGPLAAEEANERTDQCDTAYDACLEKCEKAEDGSEKCYEACEKEYDVCLASAQQNQ